MSAAMCDIRPLTEDEGRYQDVFYNAFYQITQSDNVLLEKVNQYFDTKVMKKLTDVFGRDEEFSLLGVGVGEGPHEYHFLKRLQTCFSTTYAVAVEPNEVLLQTFKDKVASLNSNGNGSVFCHGFHGPLSEFVSGSPLVKKRYNLISSIHSIYYTGDIETTFTQLTNMMKENGLIIVVAKNEDLMSKTHSKFTWLWEKTQSNPAQSSKNLHKVAESKGYDVTVVDIPMQWDITEVFDDQSDFGNKLIDFFTQGLYFRQTAPSEVMGDFLKFWRSISAEDKDGRILSPSHIELLLISK
ncbi:histamine N-methyltransferase-like [Lytechinus variegatus]|uniref:histamine N-methyltransferase-like n=1 Tax=Lytechinus variegatus TaxID=7654 RepID=UPI001BB20E6F|nr:histamine N-methyltransferase-like [Lytechinus variegatus]XP_041462120.1 histamine N-methyltransferase-like [Lytechinus variegatus]